MANQNSTLTASNIKYLLAIYDLCKVSGETRCIRVAEILRLSKPSVHTMIINLKNMSLVNKDLYGTITFTQAGMKLAEQYSQYFEVISAWFETILENSTDVRLAVCAVMAELDKEQLKEMCNNIAEESKRYGKNYSKN